MMADERNANGVADRPMMAELRSRGYPSSATCQPRRRKPVTAFTDRVSAFFDEFFRLDPVTASAIGDHRFDDRWPDMSEAGHAARVAFADRWIAELRVIDPSTL